MHVSHPYPAQSAAGVVIDPELMCKYDKPGPRYTSYPTADRFIEAYDAPAHQMTLRQRNMAWAPGASVAACCWSLILNTMTSAALRPA